MKKNKIYLLNNLIFDGIVNLEVFKIKYLESTIDLTKYDALIFTSKNGVYAVDSFNKQWKDIPSYAIALKTANVIKKCGGEVGFIGSSGHGNDFALELISKLQNQKALYIRAKDVVSNLIEILRKNSIDIDELIAYETVCNKDINTELEKNSIFIFTSPSSIKCFFSKYIWDDSYKAIVIGKTTAKFMPKGIDYIISSETSVEECIKEAQKITF